MLRRKVLVVSSDAGGTLALLPVVRELVRHDAHVHAVGSGPAISIWQRERLPCEWDSVDDGIGEMVAAATIDAHRPDVLLSGAGAYNTIEHTFRRAAADAHVFCFALVDGWFNFKARFERGGTSDVTTSVPDLIGVMDAASCEEMIEEGFARERVVVVGAPHIEETVSQVTSASMEEVDRLRTSFGLYGDLPTFAFFSGNVLEETRLGAGQTQTAILSEVVGALVDAGRERGEPLQLLVKPHPSEVAAALAAILETAPADRLVSRLVEYGRSSDLICLADGVLGIRSTVLLEAAMCGRPALSLQFGRDVSRYPDKYFGQRPGITAVYDAGQCRPAIRHLLSGAGRIVAPQPAATSCEATSKVLEAILGLPARANAGRSNGR